jgi:RecA-family ATPase
MNQNAAIDISGSSSPMLAHALDYAERGWHVFPCWPGDKSPCVGNDKDERGRPVPKTGGLYKATTDEAQITTWWRRWPSAMIGVRMGEASGVWAIDPDAPKDETRPDGRAAWARLTAQYGNVFTHAHLTPGGGQHILFKWDASRPIGNKEGMLKGTGINVRGEGGYVIAPPSINSEGRSYQVVEPLDHFRFADAPDWLYDLVLKPSISEQAAAKVERPAPRADRRPYADAALRGECDELAASGNGDRNNQLNKAAFKLGTLVGAGELSEGEVIGALFDAASACGLLADDGQRAVMATISSGLQEGVKKPREIPERAELPENPAIDRKDESSQSVVPTLRIIDPTTWQDKPVPEREWVVKDMIPANTVSLLMGDGAAGKTTLSLQLSVARALARDWIGTLPTDGRTLFLSAEDDEDEMHRRVDAVRQHYGAPFEDLKDLRLVDLVGENAVLGELQKNGIIKATPLLAAVVAEVERFRPDLVVIDALADAFAGDENNRTQARQFIGLLKKPAKEFRTAFLCLAHPSLYGMNSGAGTSGSTGWSNSVRSRLYFESAKASDDSAPDPDLRQLSVKKTNYGPIGHPIAVRWKNGVYVPEGGLSSLDRLALAEKAKDVFLTLLRTFNEQGQNVTATPCSTYAPTMFAKHPKGAGIAKSHFATAMQDLLDKKMIRIETFGPPSKQRQRLVY